ncbi:MAG: DUF192 domain-containing protein [Magnetospirillum sp.]|nr:DUF192 domain-containing protein [Magnetospirillum sp.]
MRWIRLAVFSVALLAAGVAAAQMPPQTVMDFGHSLVMIDLGGGAKHAFSVEVATTPAQHSQGLMYRRELAADAGMLFDFGDPQDVSMWMKNTFIPLDMVFIADDGRIVGITQRAVPQSLAIIASPQPVRAVLEINGGRASSLGIRVGDRVSGAIFGPAR